MLVKKVSPEQRMSLFRVFCSSGILLMFKIHQTPEDGTKSHRIECGGKWLLNTALHMYVYSNCIYILVVSRNEHNAFKFPIEIN